MEPITFVVLALGVLGTWVGAEMLVRGSSEIALAFGVRPLVIGLTVVAFGTSSPEAVVSFVAAARHSPGIAVGNVLGSNIANIGLILAVVCLIRPVRVRWEEIRSDLWIMLAASVLSAALLWWGALGRAGGGLLLLCLAGTLVYYLRSDHEPPTMERESGLEARRARARRQLRSVVVSVVGLGLLVAGARALVESAEAIARALDVGEELIGATMVAVGTSLPELAASVVAVLRGQDEIGIGNIVGSNMMNLLFVLGGVAVISPVQASAGVRGLLLPAMLIFSLALLLLLRGRARIGRRVGGVLLAGYATFALVAYL